MAHHPLPPMCFPTDGDTQRYRNIAGQPKRGVATDPIDANNFGLPERPLPDTLTVMVDGVRQDATLYTVSLVTGVWTINFPSAPAGTVSVDYHS